VLKGNVCPWLVNDPLNPTVLILFNPVAKKAITPAELTFIGNLILIAWLALISVGCL
jgi:hypothetical protein